jgi:transposase
MELNQKQCKRTAPLPPKQRGNVKIENLTLLNALVYICGNGRKRRDLPEKLGHWHSVYMRFSRWAKSGVLERAAAALRAEGLLAAKVYSLYSTSIKFHSDAQGDLKKREAGDREAAGRVERESSRGGGKRRAG